MRFSYLLLVLLFFVAACADSRSVDNKPAPIPSQENESDLWSQTQAYYLEKIRLAMSYLDSIPQTSDITRRKELFRKSREAFKLAEPYASYLNWPVGHRANGPALPVLTDDSQRVLPPMGLQKIEETLFEGEEYPGILQREISLTLGLMKNLEGQVMDHSINPQRFFTATHHQLLRVLSFSITGFDTPVSKWGLEEGAKSLESLFHVYDLSIRNLIQERDPTLDNAFHAQVERAANNLREAESFDDFDRYTFVREFLNPLMSSWVEIRQLSQLWEPSGTEVFNFDASTFFEGDSFNPGFFMPVSNKRITEAQSALGEKLFYEPKLSKSGTMSCVSCHMPENAWADARQASPDNQGIPLERNTPTLVNAIYQQGYFWDGRADNIMAQISSVFTNEKEFDSGVHTFSSEILSDPTYTELFKEAYNGLPGRNTEVVKALATYISTLNGMNSRFDRNIRGELNDLSKEEIEGFNLFSGKALCATCHFLPMTNGTVPPVFLETEKEVIGVPMTAENLQLDDDLGFYWRFEKPGHRGMFKTPTVRNVAETAPYMHNGVYNTLEEVMDFYNKGGGAGMGFDLEYQTLPFDNLELTPTEIKALVAFMKTLSDSPRSRQLVIGNQSQTNENSTKISEP